MRLTAIVLSASLLSVVFASPQSQAADAPAASQPNVPPPGFVALFNGVDLAGWQGLEHFDPRKLRAMSPDERAAKFAKNWEDVQQHWTVENGELVNDGKGAYLTTLKEYGDFELWLEYKTVAKADSGIYLRATPQVQIWDTTEAGGKWNLGADKGSGSLWNNQKHARFPLALADKPFGEWNSLRMTMIGENVTVYFNDQLVVSDTPLENFWDRSRSVFPVGPIQLQTHGGEIRWRNVFIREFPRRPPEAGVLTLEETPVGEGWRALVNSDGVHGLDFDGAQWKFDAGVLTATAVSAPAQTTEEFGDFELHALVRVSGNHSQSGIRIREPRDSAESIGAYLVSVGDQSWGAISQPGGDGEIVAGRGAVSPVKSGDWNHLYVSTEGDYLQGWLNGVKLIDVIHPRGPAKGLVSLLGATGDGAKVEYKSVSIRPAGADPRSPGFDSEEGFVSLFNGTDLSGWQGATQTHQVEHGVLISPKGGGGNLYTEKQYGDFILRFDFTVESGGNNGVGIRAEMGKDAAYHGMELQILDNTSPGYAKLKPYQYHGSIYGVAPSKRGYQNPLGYWNTQEVYAKGNHIRVTLNGKVIVDADIEKEGKPQTVDGRPHPGLFSETGYIGFLGHGHQLKFRNIRIKELKE